MNLDDLKSTWQTYDEKLRNNQQLSEQLIFLMIRDRSKGILARMMRELRLAGIIMTGVVGFFTAAIAGNAFDYPHWSFYAPAVLYINLALFALAVVIKNHRRLNRVNLSRENLHGTLTTVLHWQEKAHRSLGRVWMLCLLAGFLFTGSMVARKYDAYGLPKTLVLLGGQALFILLTYAIARWVFRAFENTLGRELNENLQELNQLT